MAGQMAHTIVLGGGLCGLTAAMMLARDGHRVTVLERDPDPVPADPGAAWESWRRDGVTQFRQAHYMQPLGRQVLDAELPDVRRALQDAGALRLNPLDAMPPSITDRTPRPGDERFVTWTARRSLLEQVIGRAADAETGLEIRRGVTVAALETRRIDGRLHITGVRTGSGERIAGDLVVDAMGRGSSAAEAARRGRRRSGSRGHRGRRVPLLHTLLPLRRRQPAADPRVAQQPRRIVLDPDPAGRGRDVVGHALRLLARPVAEGAARPGALDRARSRAVRATPTGSRASRSPG